MAPRTRYARSGDLSIAYQVVGDGPIDLVGHSFGGAVAMKAAMLLGARAGRMVLFEPNPFSLLRQAGRMDAYMEARSLRDHVKCYGALGEWSIVAERFVDYWVGDGAWRAMPEKRRAAFVEALPPNFHEWDAVTDEQTTLDQWAALRTETLVMTDAAPRAPLREIAAMLEHACPHWTFHALTVGGHMAPLTHPEVVNPVIARFLDTGAP